VYENYLLLRCKVDGNEILIGGGVWSQYK
jgi:hypothetical protein